MNYNTANKCFYPYTVSPGFTINGINYVTHPGGLTTPAPAFKYYISRLLSGTTWIVGWGEENNFSTYKDWVNVNNFVLVPSVSFESYFITGYQLGGKALTRFQPTYVYVFSRNDEDTAYKIQSVWDYANDPNSGRWSSRQLITISKPNYGMVFRRHKLRGQGLVLQIKITSADGEPFDIMGWSMPLQVNASV